MKLVIFDLGNTLVKYQGVSLNWSEHYSNAISTCLSNQGIDPDLDKMNMAISILTFYNTRENFRLFEVEEGEVLKKVSKVFLADERIFVYDFFKYFQRKTVIEESCIETIFRLKQEGHNTAVLTDVPYGMPKTFVNEDSLQFTDALDMVLSSCDVGFRKPNTTGLSLILSKFNIEKDNAFYIGDEEKDVQCANEAGINSILLSDTKKDWGQKYTISRVADIFDVI